jgi:uncharacterized protein (TIGR02284 family)
MGNTWTHDGEAMTTTHASATDVLNRLIVVCQDGEKGFDTAADAIKDQSLKAELMQYSQDRRACISELVRALGAIGEQPGDGGSISGAMRRGWMNIIEAISDDNEHAILAACERGEDATVEAYSDAMSVPLPSPLNGLIAMQYESVKRIHDCVRGLRDAVAND